MYCDHLFRLGIITSLLKRSVCREWHKLIDCLSRARSCDSYPTQPLTSTTLLLSRINCIRVSESIWVCIKSIASIISRSSIGFLTSVRALHDNMKCSAVSSPLWQIKQVGSTWFWLKQALFSCRVYDPVASFNLVFSRVTSLTSLVCCISQCFLPGEKSSVLRYWSEG